MSKPKPVRPSDLPTKRVYAPDGSVLQMKVAESSVRIYTGAVKWFDMTRGFGFVAADDESVGDILIHFSVLRAHGRRSLPEGARIECRASVRDRGLQASEILSIDLSETVEPLVRPGGEGGRGDLAEPVDHAGPIEIVTGPLDDGTPTKAKYRIARSDGGTLKVRIVDADGPAFGADFQAAFAENVRRARRENKAVKARN